MSILPLFPAQIIPPWALVILIVVVWLLMNIALLLAFSAMGILKRLGLFIIWVLLLFADFALFWQAFVDYPSSKPAFAIMALVAAALNLLFVVFLLVFTLQKRHQDHWNA